MRALGARHVAAASGVGAADVEHVIAAPQLVSRATALLLLRRASTSASAAATGVADADARGDGGG